MTYILRGFVLEKEPRGLDRTRMMVRIRDKFTCQDCGDIRTPEQAKLNRKRLFDCHHLNGLCGKKSHGYDKVSEIDGLITLCHKCHYNRPEHRVKQHFTYRTESMDKRDIEIQNLRKYGYTLNEIGKEYNISWQRVQQIMKISTV